MTNIFSDLLGKQGYVMIDGGMGTMLMDVGLVSGDPPEEWNVAQPEKIEAVHQAYVEAGSNIILTNTFGGSSFRLKLHKYQDRSYEFNKAGAEIARRVADAADHPVFVAGSMGPSGELLFPLGVATPEEIAASFAEQARGLVDGGVDLLWIETMSDLSEVQAVVEGIRTVTDLPIAATLSFDTRGRTMMGVTAQQAAEELGKLGLVAIGGNCGNGLDELADAVEAMRAVDSDILLIAKSNAGIPKWINNQLEYDGTPEIMAAFAQRVHGLGANLIGACCGSNPTHIAAMNSALALQHA